jgi:hypothetical protein
LFIWVRVARVAIWVWLPPSFFLLFNWADSLVEIFTQILPFVKSSPSILLKVFSQIVWHIYRPDSLSKHKLSVLIVSLHTTSLDSLSWLLTHEWPSHTLLIFASQLHIWLQIFSGTFCTENSQSILASCSVLFSDQAISDKLFWSDNLSTRIRPVHKLFAALLACTSRRVVLFLLFESLIFLFILACEPSSPSFNFVKPVRLSIASIGGSVLFSVSFWKAIATLLQVFFYVWLYLKCASMLATASLWPFGTTWLLDWPLESTSASIEYFWQEKLLHVSIYTNMLSTF